VNHSLILVLLAVGHKTGERRLSNNHENDPKDFLEGFGCDCRRDSDGRLGFDLSPIEAYAQELRIKGAKETTTICCYCSVGCGIIVHTDSKGKVINAEGDPDHPISEGALVQGSLKLSDRCQ